MEGLLTPLRTISTPRDEEPLLTVSKPSQPLQIPEAPVTAPISITDLDDVLSILRSKPSIQTLSHVLNLLAPAADTFNVRKPSPKASQVVKTLLELTIPDFWNVISKSERAQLLGCLRSTAGIGGIVARLRVLIKGADSQPRVKGQIEELLDLLQGIMGMKGFVHEIWVSGEGFIESRRVIMWKEFVALLGGGKVLGVAAEAESVLGRGGRERWVGDGKKFASWLGKEIARAGEKFEVVEEGDEWKALATLLSRGFGLGYSDDLVEILTYFHVHPPISISKLHCLLSSLQSHDKRTYLISLLRVLSRRHITPSESSLEFDPKWWQEDAYKISQLAALLSGIIASDNDFRDLAVDWLVSPNGGGVGEPIGIRRALVVVLSRDEMVLKELLERSFGQFGDKIWIRHTPIMRQEVNVQLLLLSAGYAQRLMPQFLHRLARSSIFLSGVSNRLGASSTRARFLGMIVGESISEMTDKDGKPMQFGVEETATEEAKWWKSIHHVEDTVSSVAELDDAKAEMVVKKKKQGKPKAPTQISSVIQVFEEIEEDEKDDDLRPYPKPDSDAEDSDDDPTLVSRKKDTAPVYIRDLILYLRATDSYDRQLLALQSAASLIRRKAGFGKELSDHAEELTSLITGLHDKFDMENFQEMRMQALIALIVALPYLVGGLLARGFFEGDYSLGQRAGMMSAIGMGARELAGIDDTDLPLSEASGKGKSAITGEMFPSKRLLGRMHEQWSGKGKADPLDRITGGMEKMMISPMAAEAADKVTGPNVLKVRTFSSRIEVEKRRVKPVESRLGKVVAEAFFFPLTGRWWGALKDFGGQGIHFESFLLTIFLKTLSIILHATGPSAVTLPQMTGELWDLLFSLRSQHQSNSTDNSVQEAVLFALLTLLEVNTANDNGRRLAEEHAKELVETQEWVGGILERGIFGEEEKGRVLAASVLMRINGIVEAYQRRLMGELLSLEA